MLGRSGKVASCPRTHNKGLTPARVKGLGVEGEESGPETYPQIHGDGLLCFQASFGAVC